MEKSIVESKRAIYGNTDATLDIVLLHSPHCWAGHCTAEEESISWREGWRNLEFFMPLKNILAIGVSNFTVAQTAALAHFLTVPLASHQPEFSPLATAPLFDGLFDQAMTHGMAVLAWSPLGGGRLANPSDERSKAVAALLDA